MGEEQGVDVAEVGRRNRMKTIFYERTFSPDFSEHLSIWHDTVEMGFTAGAHPDDIWGVLRLSTAESEKAAALYKNNPEKQVLGNEAVIRIRWYSEAHFWISEATKLPDNFVLEKIPSKGCLRSCISQEEKQADFALAFAVRQSGSESIWERVILWMIFGNSLNLFDGENK